MSINIGTAIILIAVLIFYARLMIIQRKREKRSRQPPGQIGGQKKVKGSAKTRAALESYSIISRNPRNWVIAGAGVAGVLLGLLLYFKVIPIAGAESLFWLPIALGIIAFSFGFE